MVLIVTIIITLICFGDIRLVYVHLRLRISVKACVLVSQHIMERFLVAQMLREEKLRPLEEIVLPTEEAAGECKIQINNVLDYHAIFSPLFDINLLLQLISLLFLSSLSIITSPLS